MKQKKKLNVGLVGYGFMGRTHSNAFGQVNNFFELDYEPVLKAVCARDADKVKAFAGQWGYESVETDWRKLVARKDIDLIDIASPNNTHAEIAIAAAGAGKMVLCEKPLGMNGGEAAKMVRAVEKSGVPNMVWYNYRRVPAVALAKQLIDEGRLGRIFHDAPNILHYGKAGTGPELKPGMFFTVEPMVNAGTWQVKILGDGWTAVTRDKQLSAQFEHSVGVTETGVEFFTLSPLGLAKPPYDLTPAEQRQAVSA